MVSVIGKVKFGGLRYFLSISLVFFGIFLLGKSSAAPSHVRDFCPVNDQVYMVGGEFAGNKAGYHTVNIQNLPDKNPQYHRLENERFIRNLMRKDLDLRDEILQITSMCFIRRLLVIMESAHTVEINS